MKAQAVINALNDYLSGTSIFSYFTEPQEVTDLKAFTASLGNVTNERELTPAELLKFVRIVLGYCQSKQLWACYDGMDNDREFLNKGSYSDTDHFFERLTSVIDQSNSDSFQEIIDPLNKVFGPWKRILYLDQAGLLDEENLPKVIAQKNDKEYGMGLMILTSEKILYQNTLDLIGQFPDQGHSLSVGLQMLNHASYNREEGWRQYLPLSDHSPAQYDNQLTQPNIALLCMNPAFAARIVDTILPFWYRYYERQRIPQAGNLDRLCVNAEILTDEGVKQAFGQMPEHLHTPENLNRILENCDLRNINPSKLAVIRTIREIAGLPQEQHREEEKEEKRQIINAATKQSTHTASVHKSASENATRAMKHYGDLIKTQVQQQAYVDAMKKWAKELITPNMNEDEKRQREAAARGLDHVTNPFYAFTDQTSGISTYQKILLAWIALHDGNNAKFKEKYQFKDVDYRLMEGLYDIARAYNVDEHFKEINNKADDKKSCDGGVFNKISQIVASTHPEWELIVISPAFASLKLNAQLNEKTLDYFKSLQEEAKTAEDEVKIFDSLREMQDRLEGLDSPIWDTIKDKIVPPLFEEYASVYKGIDDPNFVAMVDSGVKGMAVETLKLNWVFKENWYTEMLGILNDSKVAFSSKDLTKEFQHLKDTMQKLSTQDMTLANKKIIQQNVALFLRKMRSTNADQKPDAESEQLMISLKAMTGKLKSLRMKPASVPISTSSPHFLKQAQAKSDDKVTKPRITPTTQRK